MCQALRHCLNHPHPMVPVWVVVTLIQHGHDLGEEGTKGLARLGAYLSEGLNAHADWETQVFLRTFVRSQKGRLFSSFLNDTPTLTSLNFRSNNLGNSGAQVVSQSVVKGKYDADLS